uniref:Uncharacterized protein n=1 Tax=Steinernema glaseri TaxID=37863 RepID=A0A1I7ZS05_9BILA
MIDMPTSHFRFLSAEFFDQGTMTHSVYRSLERFDCRNENLLKTETADAIPTSLNRFFRLPNRRTLNAVSVQPGMGKECRRQMLPRSGNSSLLFDLCSVCRILLHSSLSSRGVEQSSGPVCRLSRHRTDARGAIIGQRHLSLEAHRTPHLDCSSFGRQPAGFWSKGMKLGLVCARTGSVALVPDIVIGRPKQDLHLFPISMTAKRNTGCCIIASGTQRPTFSRLHSHVGLSSCAWTLSGSPEESDPLEESEPRQTI